MLLEIPLAFLSADLSMYLACICNNVNSTVSRQQLLQKLPLEIFIRFWYLHYAPNTCHHIDNEHRHGFFQGSTFPWGNKGLFTFLIIISVNMLFVVTLLDPSGLAKLSGTWHILFF